MSKKTLVSFVRREVHELQRKKVYRMMQEGDVVNLRKVLQQADYSLFREISKPEFSFDELDLKTPDELKLLSIYIWSNPYIDGGDVFFFNRKGLIEFWENLELVCGKWGQDMSIILKGHHVLSELDFDGYHGMTLEGFLNPETVENVKVTVGEIDLNHLSTDSGVYFNEEVD